MSPVFNSKTVLLGSVVAVLGLLAIVTLRANRPASIAVALARGETPEAPPFTLPRLDAEGTLDLASLRGRVVVINFWASWCIPCRDEAPVIEATWERFKNRGVVVLGVDVQDLIPEALRFLRETKTTYPQVRDKDNMVYRAYGLTGVPETFFVDHAGRIVRKFPGAVTNIQEWFRAVENMLARPGQISP
jgi:cytochrome c biogenesis protein CcmG/thiol:disulfide interchange protein DsbE